MNTPLSHRTVLDCSILLPGPFTGKLLADLGAQVIKIENPNRPDPAKIKYPEHYEVLNKKKEIIQLDIKKEKEKFNSLLKSSHGLIEGYRFETAKKLGLDEKSLLKINPTLCIASIKGYTKSERPGHDLNFIGQSGLFSRLKTPPGVPLSQWIGSTQTALQLVAAMDQAEHSQRGIHLSISLTETIKNYLLPEFEISKKTPQNHGTTLLTGRYPCYRVYQTQDHREITVAAIEPHYWEIFCKVINRPDFIKFQTVIDKERDQIVNEIQRILMSKQWKEWAPLFEANPCCVELVLNDSEVLSGF
ncbi:MAG: hypothetical protein CL678_08730 [Bdellovibrionaceae bacterium]|nr:hypothetical protein [Pseudobdellovibrionaceae bacterium]|tara:strand:+ start:3047 stop:3955 length:909 start_codon:yes stop_codon:yes gene_type:complete